VSNKNHSLIKSLIEGIKQPKRIAILFLTGFIYLLSFMHISNWLLKMTLDIAFWGLLTYSFKELCWRIEKDEYKKLVPIIVQFLAAIFIYTTSRQIKDSILNSTCGNESAAFAKVLILFIGIIYNFFYIKISKKIRMSGLIYVTVLPTLIYFIIFDRFLFEVPNIELSNSVCTAIKNFSVFGWKIIPSKMINLLKYWHISLYYIFAELFAVSGLAIFCWKIANSQFEKHQTKRIYPVLMLMSQFATLASGYVGSTSKIFSKYSMFIRFNTNILIILFVILVINNYYFFLSKDHPGNNIELKPKEKDGIKTEKKGFVESIKGHYIFFLVALLTVYYGLSAVFLEQFWKKNITEFALFQAKQKISTLAKITNASEALNIVKDFDKKATLATAISVLKSKITNNELLDNFKKIYYGDFFSKYMIGQAKFSFLFVIFGTNILIETMSWTSFASFTPISTILGCIFILGVPMFAKFTNINSVFGVHIYQFVAYIGGIFIALFKSLKYSSFDPTKEQYIVSLSQEDRIIVKNIEGYTGRIGKSGGGLILLLLFSIDSLGLHLLHGGIMAFLFVSVFLMSIVWYYSIIKIGHDYEEKHKHDTK